MDYIRYLFISAFILGICTHLTEGEFTCFRKYRKKRDNCGGIVKKKKFNTPEKCCARKGKGFTETTLEFLGRNSYSCTSCVEWENSRVTSTTSSPSTTTDPLPAEWGVWGDCSTSCGSGWRSRYRQCSNCDKNHFSNVQSEPCIVQFYCPVDGNWGPWHSWQDCSQTCDGGVRKRTRRCNYPPPTHGGRNCEGEEEDSESCNEEPCPVDGGWSQWSRFSYCSASCGPGTMSRTRNCNTPSPANGGSNCRGSRVQHKRCQKRPCPVDGGWSTWGEWSECPVTCGTGVRTRSRDCNRPHPLFGGRNCEGDSVDTEPCEHDVMCPIHGGWSEWRTYGQCRGPPCGKGHMIRSRVCNNPRPQHRGRMCSGRSVIRIPCENTEGCPVDGGWCDFTPWSRCSATCSSMASMQTRRRTCTCPHPGNGGKYCEGDDTELQQCTGVPACEDPLVIVQNGPEFVEDIGRGEEDEKRDVKRAVIEER